MRKTEDILREELPAPLNEWALSQVNKNWEGWRDECFSLQKAIICFAEWHKTKEGWRYWYDVAFNDLHKHPDVVRKTLTKQEKDLQMEGKSEKQLPYKAMSDGELVEVLAEHDGMAWITYREGVEHYYYTDCLSSIHPLSEYPLTFGEWINEFTKPWLDGSASIHVDDATRLYNQYQEYLKTFEG